MNAIHCGARVVPRKLGRLEASNSRGFSMHGYDEGGQIAGKVRRSPCDQKSEILKRNSPVENSFGRQILQRKTAFCSKCFPNADIKDKPSIRKKAQKSPKCDSALNPRSTSSQSENHENLAPKSNVMSSRPQIRTCRTRKMAEVIHQIAGPTI
jgi:hypothetical protein